MAGQPVDIHFPLGGKHEGMGFQNQPPYTSRKLVNVWPRDVFQNSLRGGSRPGLARQLGSGVAGPVHLLANVRAVEASGYTTYEDLFPGTILGSHWSLLSGYQQVPGVKDGYAFAESGFGVLHSLRGAVLSSLNIDTTVNYHVDVFLLPDLRASIDIPNEVIRTFRIFARLHDTLPNPLADSIEVALIFTATAPLSPSLQVNETIAGVLAFTESKATVLPFPNDLIQLQLDVTGSACRATVFYDAGVSTVISWTAGAAVGQRFGFSIAGAPSVLPSGTAWKHRVDLFRSVYKGTPTLQNRNIVVVAGGTNAGAGSKLDVKYEDLPDTLIAPSPVSASVVNPKARHLQAAELNGRLYIVGEDTASVWCLSPLGAGTIGTIAEVHAVGGVHAFSPVPSGTPPTNTIWIAAWRQRIVTGGKRDDPNDVFMSKSGEPQNWNYGSLPIGRACRFTTTGIDTGKLGEPSTCGIAHSDDYLILGCLSSLFVLRGDPTYGGQIDRLSGDLGIVAPQAYARGPEGQIVFLAQAGLYEIPAGVMSYPAPVSEDPLPLELRYFDQNNYRVLLGYDVRNRGVFIGATPIVGSGGTYYWMDWGLRKFFPMEFDPAFEPTSLVYRSSDAPSTQRLLLGCRDGNIRAFNDKAFTDDGLNFRSELLIGPIAHGSGGYFDGMILEVVGQLSEESADLDLDVQVGNSIENAFNAKPRRMGKLRAGKNRTYRPRLRGNASFLRLSTPGGGAWAYENMTVVREQLGKQRL